MADIYLGPTMSGAPLPPIRWINGASPALPIDFSKQVEKAEMIDGAQRFNFKSRHPRKWSLQWEMLTYDEMMRMIALNEINDSLNFQNNWESAEWRTVVITSFEYTPIVKLGSSVPGGSGSAAVAACRFNLSMGLDEVV
jgi:hypothetical protein